MPWALIMPRLPTRTTFRIQATASRCCCTAASNVRNAARTRAKWSKPPGVPTWLKMSRDTCLRARVSTFVSVCFATSSASFSGPLGKAEGGSATTTKRKRADSSHDIQRGMRYVSREVPMAWGGHGVLSAEPPTALQASRDPEPRGDQAAVRRYWMAYRPKHWLFPLRDGVHPIDPRSAQKIYYAAKRKAGITKRCARELLLSGRRARFSFQSGGSS